jgi:hypothetical protein
VLRCFSCFSCCGAVFGLVALIVASAFVFPAISCACDATCVDLAYDWAQSRSAWVVNNSDTLLNTTGTFPPPPGRRLLQVESSSSSSPSSSLPLPSSTGAVDDVVEGGGTPPSLWRTALNFLGRPEVQGALHKIGHAAVAFAPHPPPPEPEEEEEEGGAESAETPTTPEAPVAVDDEAAPSSRAGPHHGPCPLSLLLSGGEGGFIEPPPPPPFALTIRSVQLRGGLLAATSVTVMRAPVREEEEEVEMRDSDAAAPPFPVPEEDENDVAAVSPPAPVMLAPADVAALAVRRRAYAAGARRSMRRHGGWGDDEEEKEDEDAVFRRKYGSNHKDEEDEEEEGRRGRRHRNDDDEDVGPGPGRPGVALLVKFARGFANVTRAEFRARADAVCDKGKPIAALAFIAGLAYVVLHMIAWRAARKLAVHPYMVAADQRRRAHNAARRQAASMAVPLPPVYAAMANNANAAPPQPPSTDGGGSGGGAGAAAAAVMRAGEPLYRFVPGVGFVAITDAPVAPAQVHVAVVPRQLPYAPSAPPSAVAAASGDPQQQDSVMDDLRDAVRSALEPVTSRVGGFWRARRGYAPVGAAPGGVGVYDDEPVGGGHAGHAPYHDAPTSSSSSASSAAVSLELPNAGRHVVVLSGAAPTLVSLPPPGSPAPAVGSAASYGGAAPRV